jgi:hypothetical protein
MSIMHLKTKKNLFVKCQLLEETRHLLDTWMGDAAIRLRDVVAISNLVIQERIALLQLRLQLNMFQLEMGFEPGTLTVAASNGCNFPLSYNTWPACSNVAKLLSSPNIAVMFTSWGWWHISVTLLLGSWCCGLLVAGVH